MIRQITINAVIQYIEKNLEQHAVSIEELVLFSGYSRRYLQKIFKDITGITLGKYIQLRRVTRAAIYLRLTNLPLVNISELLCYDSQQTFTREFKKNTGYTPQQYRKNRLWTFEKMTNRKDLICNLPIPELIRREAQVISGRRVTYMEKLPYYNANILYRLDKIGVKLSKKGDQVTLSNRVLVKEKNKIKIETLVRELEGEVNNGETVTLKAGLYAHFSFECKEEFYSIFINNIYMTALPFYGLSPDGDYDLELIERADAGIIHCDYFIFLKTDEIPSG